MDNPNREHKSSGAISGLPASSSFQFSPEHPHTLSTSSNRHSTNKTCADSHKSWVELLDRLGSLPKLTGILTDGLEILRRQSEADGAALLLCKGPAFYTITRIGSISLDCPAAMLENMRRHSAIRFQELWLCCVQIHNEVKWLLVTDGKTTPTTDFLRSPSLGFFRCALHVYASAFTRYGDTQTSNHPVLSPRQRRLRRLFPEIITSNPEVIEILSLVKTFAKTDYPILIQGESGTGKELIARAIHNHSRRAEGPYCAENCAAIPETLLEAEFFGVIKGAYTGADSNREGLLNIAHNGTLFLDEVGEMPFALQKKLLRVLQEGRYRPVGSQVTKQSDVRFITATNCPLEELVKKKRFRSDLFFRLETVTLTLPPLRDRLEDIPLLADHFLKQFRLNNPYRKVCEASTAFPEETLDALKSYHWPGNIREFQNEVKRAAVLANGSSIMPSHLSKRITEGQNVESTSKLLKGSMDLLEYEQKTVGTVIKQILTAVNGNRAACAKLLGIPKTNLYRRMQRYGIFDAERRTGKKQ